MSTWEEAENIVKNAENGGLFVRLENDQDCVYGTFCGDPHIREVVWFEGKTQEYDAKKHAGEKPRSKFSLNFFDCTTGQMRIIEGGITWFKEVLEARKEYGEENVFKVKRIGAKGDKRTTYKVLFEERLTDDLKKRIAESPVHELGAPVASTAAETPF